MKHLSSRFKLLKQTIGRSFPAARALEHSQSSRMLLFVLLQASPQQTKVQASARSQHVSSRKTR
jgi:hypothetical protein